ncbi:hypothetical protein HDV02_000857 [Globomyces sp. JEL0801]|nr:hypothetical protein HDV02_000857 [Globomyces sp. JEL0801]
MTTTIIKGNEEASTYIDSILKIDPTFKEAISSGLITVEEKTGYIHTLLDSLGESPEWDNSALQSLRLLCREPTGSEAFFSEKTITTFVKFSGLKNPSAKTLNDPIAVEALKCLNNVQTCSADMRLIFANSEYIPLITEGLNMGPIFLLTRLSFFVTATDQSLCQTMINDHLPDTLAKILNKLNGGKYTDEDWISSENCINEILKASFNLTLKFSSIQSSSFFGVSQKTMVETENIDTDIYSFRELLSEIVISFVSSKLQVPTMSPPHSHAINTLMNFQCLEFEDQWFPNGDYKIIEMLLDIFEDCLRIMCPEESRTFENDMIFGTEVDQALAPLLILMKKLTVNPQARLLMKKRLMPKSIDRTKELTKGSSLTAHWIRSLSDVCLSQTRDFMCEFMIALCDNNSDEFIGYVGYGNAAGFLFNRGMFGSGLAEAAAKAKATAANPNEPNIDPISGTIRKEVADPWKDMTEEERERESERLFVLFDRLNKTGVIKAMPRNN